MWLIEESEEDKMDNKEFEEVAQSAWKEVFPHSLCSVRVYLGGACFVGYLAGDRKEFINGISQNDHLNYAGWLEGGNYKEDRASAHTRPPEGSYLVYGGVKLRKKTIKQVDRAKLVKRFLELKAFLVTNKDAINYRLAFNLDEKLGL